MKVEFESDGGRRIREFRCSKCGCEECYEHGISTAGKGLFRALLDANTNEYDSLVCKECGFVEWYALYLSGL